MYEKLDKLRAELSKAREKRADADAKVKQLEQKLKEAENMQILSDVGALKLTPEQLAEFLQLVKNGQLQEVDRNPVSFLEENKVNEESEDVDDED